METVCVIETARHCQLKKPPSAQPIVPSTPSAATEALNQNQSPVSPPKFGHQRNLSLDFRSMGIILPPLSATILSHK